MSPKPNADGGARKGNDDRVPQEETSTRTPLLGVEPDGACPVGLVR